MFGLFLSGWLGAETPHGSTRHQSGLFPAQESHHEVCNQSEMNEPDSSDPQKVTNCKAIPLTQLPATGLSREKHRAREVTYQSPFPPASTGAFRESPWSLGSLLMVHVEDATQDFASKHQTARKSRSQRGNCLKTAGCSGSNSATVYKTFEL